jgi:choline dehydrogenase-like flavoprotein
MAGFDYDVVIVGSGFGGSVAALRAAGAPVCVFAQDFGRDAGIRTRTKPHLC